MTIIYIQTIYQENKHMTKGFPVKPGNWHQKIKTHCSEAIACIFMVSYVFVVKL